MRKKYALDFLLYSYFEITTAIEDEDEIIVAAIKRAYRDATNRVVAFVSEMDSWKMKKNIISIMKEEIIKVLKDEKDYGKFHKDTCTMLINNYNDIVDISSGTKFTYGIAQKWINMTMKYLCVIYSILGKQKNTEKYYKKVNKLEKKLDIPIDSYILESVSKVKKENEYRYGFSIEIPNKEKYGGMGNYNEEKSLPWSKWESSDDYSNFQNDVKKEINELKNKLEDKKKFDSNIEWENLAWIEVARKRKKKEETAKNNKYCK